VAEDARLREKLTKIEALFAGAGTDGERLAAAAALERVRARLAEQQRRDPTIEMQFSLPDPWSRRLFVALCRRYGLAPYRYPRQRHQTVMLRGPRKFLDEILWPEFQALNEVLAGYLEDVTLRVIREEVFADASEAPEVPQTLHGRAARGPSTTSARRRSPGPAWRTAPPTARRR
jgi:hypothetical protein